MDTTFTEPEARLSVPVSAPGFYVPGMFAMAGRIGRLRYFAYACAASGAAAVVVAVIMLLATGVMMGLLLTLTYLMFILASFVLAVRRLNDLNLSGWTSLGLLVPFVNVLLSLYATFAPGTQGANRFGAAPTPNSRKLAIAGVGGAIAFFMLAIALATLPFLRHTIESANSMEAVIQAENTYQVDEPGAHPSGEVKGSSWVGDDLGSPATHASAVSASFRPRLSRHRELLG